MFRYSKRISNNAIVATLFCSGIALASGHVGAQSVGDITKVEVVGTVPESLESFAVMPDGSFLITQNRSGILRRLKKDGQVDEFAKLTMHPVGIIAIKDGYLITADNRPAAVPGAPPPQNLYADVGTEAVLLDKNGSVVKRFPGKPGQFFNGLTQAGKIFLIADSVGDTILQLDLKKEIIEPWLKDENLKPAAGRIIGGANGIKAYNGWVYVSNSTRGNMYRIGIDSEGRPKGSLDVYASIQGLDDFGIAKDGTIYAPSGMSIMKISPGGQFVKFLDPVLGGPFALVTQDQHWLYWGTRAAGQAAASAGPGALPPLTMVRYLLK